MLYYFRGIKSGQDRMLGYIRSSELIQGFNEKWIPSYQRERVQRRGKVKSLIEIFRSGSHIDTIKLNLVGKVEREKRGEAENLVLDGDFHVIDGQQRLWALKDSGVTNYDMPVELYLNLSMDEEVRLFQQFNSDPTKLTFSEKAKSFQGPKADLLRRMLANKKLPVKMVLNNTRLGLTVSTFVPIMQWADRKLSDNRILESVPTTGAQGRFLREEANERQIMNLEYACKNLLSDYVEIFGEFNENATAYKRGFLQPWMHVAINNFLLENGKTSYGKFSTKISESQVQNLLRDSFLKELTKASSKNHSLIYQHIVDHFNHKLKGGRIPGHAEVKAIAKDEPFEEETLIERGEHHVSL